MKVESPETTRPLPTESHRDNVDEEAQVGSREAAE